LIPAGVAQREIALKYVESKERSAEFLRMVLATMSQHDAAYNPVTFTVCYEHVAGINQRLSAAFAEATRVKPRLNQDDIELLYSNCVADLDAAMMQRISSELHRMMSGMAKSASQTGSQADIYSAELQGLSKALNDAQEKNLSPVLNHVIASTAQMKDATQALEREVKQSQQEIDRLKNELTRTRDDSMKDALTGVLNRKGFDQNLANMLVQPLSEGRSHGLVMLDIDHFKSVNDTHGHVMGDRVLQALGEVLRMLLINEAGCTVARYGGEEFAIMMPDTDLARCQSLAEKVRLHTRAMKIRDRRTKEVVLTVTISGGVAVMHEGDDAPTLIARADTALYLSKQTGRDRITCG
jgi:diguanylate cyclase